MAQIIPFDANRKRKKYDNKSSGSTSIFKRIMHLFKKKQHERNSQYLKVYKC